MVLVRNPFKPTAGARPPLLVGRQDSLDSFREGLEDGSGAPGLLTIFTGARGVGKTVMLTEAEDVAIEAGWAVVTDTATPGLINRLTRAIQKHLDELGRGPTGRRITAVTIAGSGVTTMLPPDPVRDLRTVATELTALLAAHGTGLVISIDEIHAVDRAELTELAAAIQHLIREELPVSLLVAGIPKSVSDLLNERVSTFLRRAERVDLRDVLIWEVEAAFAQTFRDTGIIATEAQIQFMADATEGYPFLIQLVGYQVWRLAVDGALTDAAVTQGIAAAHRRLGSTVLQASLSDLSQVDRTFLLKMAEDDGPSRVSEIALRLGETAKYVSTYRRRLIESGVVISAGHGLVDFAVPRLREHLREHAASSVRGRSSSESAT